jgi:hypothetical protein
VCPIRRILINASKISVKNGGKVFEGVEGGGGGRVNDVVNHLTC